RRAIAKVPAKAQAAVRVGDVAAEFCGRVGVGRAGATDGDNLRQGRGPIPSTTTVVTRAQEKAKAQQPSQTGSVRAHSTPSNSLVFETPNDTSAAMGGHGGLA